MGGWVHLIIIIRARVEDGDNGDDGVNGGMGKGLRDGNRGAGLLLDGDFYRTGETRLQGRGKGVTWRGKRRERERKGKGKEERKKKRNEKKLFGEKDKYE